MIPINFVAEVEIKGRSRKSSVKLIPPVSEVTHEAMVVPAASRNQSLQSWLIRSGNVPEAHLGVSRIGIYTDFT